MKKIIIVLLTIVIATLIWARQDGKQTRLEVENQWLSTLTNDLGGRITTAEHGLKKSRERSNQLSQQLRNLQKALTETPPKSVTAESTSQPTPDPARHGGWPVETDYLFLPKLHLTNTNYRLLAADRLTDEAALLLGLSSEEREAVNLTFANLLGRFGQLEIESMEQVDMPSGWSNMDSMEPEFSLTYRIPGLEDAMQEERLRFSQNMEQILGPDRAALIADASEAYLRQHLDDLGTGERTVGFLWEPNADGSYSIWYGISGDRFGPGSFNLISDDYNPDSQMAYYARLFGVRLPDQ